MDDKLNKIREIIHEEVSKAGYSVSRILLFGSRARGDARPDSDWDLYVIIEGDPGFRVRNDIASNICWRLIREQGLVADVFVQAESTAQAHSEDTGRLTYYVLKEGVPL